MTDTENCKAMAKMKLLHRQAKGDWTKISVDKIITALTREEYNLAINCGVTETSKCVNILCPNHVRYEPHDRKPDGRNAGGDKASPVDEE